MDVCAVSGYTRNQLRGVMDELPIYAEQETSVRVAREYSRADLSVLSVVFVLDVQFNVRRSAIAKIAGQLRQALSSPRPVNRAARLLISFDPSSVRYLPDKEPIQTGILVALGPIFERVDTYIAGNPLDNANRDLNFGPTSITDKRKVAKG